MKNKKKKRITVAGCKTTHGELDKYQKFRITRNDEVIAKDLTIHSMKILHDDAVKVEKGFECGISFEGFEGEIEIGDIIEGYIEKDLEEKKFHWKAGIHYSY